MATHDYIISNASGASVRADLNNALAAIVSNNSNATSPATTYAYQWWADTTTGQLKLRNSANSAWITIFELDGTMLMEDGTVSAPGLAFASDLNTGFFRSAADKINFATGGAERLEIGSSEVVFNDPSNDVDFRVESNGNANMLFVDAGNDRVGVGTNSPAVLLDVADSSGNEPKLRMSTGTATNFFQISRNSSTGHYTLASEENGSSIILATDPDASGAVDRLIVDRNGNVGIGGTATNYSDYKTLSIFGAANTGAGFIEFNDTSGNADAAIFADGGNLFINADYDATSADSTIRFRVDGSSEKMRIDSSGNVGVGISSPGSRIHVFDSNPEVRLQSSGTSTTCEYSMLGRDDSNVAHKVNIKTSDSALTFGTGGSSGNSYVPSERMRIDSSGRVMLGTTAEGHANADNLTVRDTGDCGITIRSGTSNQGNIYFSDATSGGGEIAGAVQYDHASNFLRFTANESERLRIDSSGRLLVGTTSAGAGDAQYSKVQIVGNSLNNEGFFRIARNENTGDMSGNDVLGRIFFTDGSGDRYGQIDCICDEAPGSNDFPGRLVFSTTADGGSSPTERVRIDSSGNVLTGTTSVVVAALTSAGVGHRVSNNGIILQVASNAQQAAAFNRTGSDGAIIGFRQAGTEEGSISVSGSTVSYNGAHLSRWSQLAGGAERIEILRGSVLSNLDEMCEWGEEDNEQLNRMKVSDVEGDVNVAGVFQTWDDDDDTYTNDFYCAMTGDFVIRIAQGTTVARGDLLMSAGDGTAKPQGDDIVRSKTIAKVTSTTVSTTYSDGSYCVPCVLMAC